MLELIQRLKRHEGVETHAYKCTANKITIGVGRNIDPEGGIGLSEDEIDYLLANDIARVTDELYTAFWWFDELDQNRQEAMINLGFNLGLPRLKKFKKALYAMSDDDYDTAANEFMDSRWADQVGQRAYEVTEMIRTGEYPNEH